MTSLPLGRFRPRIRLQTLGRGDGLLGMRPSGQFGPRSGSVTVVGIDWLYAVDGMAQQWILPAPSGLMNRRPAGARFLEADDGQALALRDRDAEAEREDRETGYSGNEDG